MKNKSVKFFVPCFTFFFKKKQAKAPQVVFILYESKGYLKHSNIFAANKHVSIQRWGMQHCLYRLFSWVYHRHKKDVPQQNSAL